MNFDLSLSSLDPSSQSWTPEEVYDEMLEVQEHLRMKQILYETKDKWDHSVVKWLSAPLFSLDIATVRKEVTTFIKTVDNLEKSMRFFFTKLKVLTYFLLHVIPLSLFQFFISVQNGMLSPSLYLFLL